MQEDEKDYAPFENAIKSLFNVCREVMKTYFQRNIMADKRDPIGNRLEKYAKTYFKTEPSEHAGYFNRIYQSNKRMILLGPQRDGWLQEGKISITYGEDCGVKTDIILHLSMIYINACRIRQDIQDEPNDLPLVENSSPGLKYPSRMMLYLYQMFHEITDSKAEKEKLMVHIGALSEEVGEGRRSGGNDPMAGIFDTVSGLAEQLTGQKIPKDKMPDSSQLSEMMNGLIKNPQTQNLLGGMMKDMKGANSLQDVLGNVLKNVGSLAGDKAAQSATQGVGSGTEGTVNANDSNRNALTESVGDVNDEFADFE